MHKAPQAKVARNAKRNPDMSRRKIVSAVQQALAKLRRAESRDEGDDYADDGTVKQAEAAVRLLRAKAKGSCKNRC
jgi:hypothetical protein